MKNSFEKKDYLVKEITARIIGRRKFSPSQSRRLNEVFFRKVAIPSGFHVTMDSSTLSSVAMLR